MSTSWKQRHADLAEAVRAEREARRTGQGVREAAARVTELIDPPEPEPEQEPTDQPA